MILLKKLILFSVGGTLRRRDRYFFLSGNGVAA